jgi:WD40 repeat protein
MHWRVQGIQCFAFDEEAHVVVTGGPDCAVRVWNPFVPSRAGLTLLGHHAGVTALVLQRGGQLVYSLARDRVIKVWDVQAQLCVQVGLILIFTKL